MLKTQEEIHKVIGWDGSLGQSRRILLEELQTYISPKKMIESGKLESLLKQSIVYQIHS